MEYIFNPEDIKKFEEQRKKYVIPDPSDELHEIYIQSTIIETLGLRAGKITDKQNATYSKFIDLIQLFLKTKTVKEFEVLKLETEKEIGHNIVLSGKFSNYEPDIRQLDSIEFQFQYLHNMISTEC